MRCKGRRRAFATVPAVGGGSRHTTGRLARRGFEIARRHPYVTGTFVACTILGGVLGLGLFSAQWSPLRRVLAGSVAGASTALLITATKLYE